MLEVKRSSEKTVWSWQRNQIELPHNKAKTDEKGKLTIIIKSKLGIITKNKRKHGRIISKEKHQYQRCYNRNNKKKIPNGLGGKEGLKRMQHGAFLDFIILSRTWCDMKVSTNQMCADTNDTCRITNKTDFIRIMHTKMEVKLLHKLRNSS